jgi:hypothetical protein
MPCGGLPSRGSSFESSSDFVMDCISSVIAIYCFSNLSSFVAALGNFASSSSLEEFIPSPLLFSRL